MLQAQTRIENVSFKQDGNNIVVNYDLYCNGSFYAQLFCSTNKGVSWHGPLSSITGDVSNVKQGQGKSITWNVLKDQNWLIAENIKFKVAEQPNKGIFTDARNNQTYKWVKTGKQVWMAENLNYDAGSNCWCYDNNTGNCNTYGRLYTWAVANNACPDGWHLPGNTEWEQLAEFISKDNGPYAKEDDVWKIVGKHLKSKSGWKSNGNGTDDYGLLALPGGGRYGSNGSFGGLGNYARFWTATEEDSSRAWGYYLRYDNSGVYRYVRSKSNGFSVRCFRD